MGEPKGRVTVGCDITFDWLDRLRLLFRGRCSVVMVVRVQNEPGLVAALPAHVDVTPILPRRRLVIEIGGDEVTRDS